MAKEQSFTKAAEQLHITQPTLSRQLASLEDELGTTLFNRGGHSVTLTEAGLLIKRRALEIIDLEDKIVDEFTANEGAIEGVITIGCGEFAAVETLAKIIGNYKEKYPMVQIVLHTGTADTIFEMMNKGLVDIGLFLQPVTTEGAAKYWRDNILIQKKLHPEIKSSTVIAWRRHIPYSKAINLFIEEINAFEA